MTRSHKQLTKSASCVHMHKLHVYATTHAQTTCVHMQTQTTCVHMQAHIWNTVTILYFRFVLKL